MDTRYDIQDRGYVSPCWIWTGPERVNGYGARYFRGRPFYAHRAAYIEAIGEIPDGLHIDHLCRQRACVRPNHLEAVPPRVNQRRAHGQPDYGREATDAEIRATRERMDALRARIDTLTRR